MSTAVEHGLIGPKTICTILTYVLNTLSKGCQVNITELHVVVLIRKRNKSWF